MRRAAVMALIVGNVIGLVNHGDKVLMGTMLQVDWIKAGLSFLIPYTVSTISSVLAIRDQERLFDRLNKEGEKP